MQAVFPRFFLLFFSSFNILTLIQLFVTCNWKATELQPNPPTQQDVVKCINLLFPIFFPHKFPVQTTRKTCTWRKEKQGKNVRSLSVWNILFRFLLAIGIWGFVRPFIITRYFGEYLCVFSPRTTTLPWFAYCFSVHFYPYIRAVKRACGGNKIVLCCAPPHSPCVPLFWCEIGER